MKNKIKRKNEINIWRMCQMESVLEGWCIRQQVQRLFWLVCREEPLFIVHILMICSLKWVQNVHYYSCLQITQCLLGLKVNPKKITKESGINLQEEVKIRNSSSIHTQNTPTMLYLPRNVLKV